MAILVLRLALLLTTVQIRGLHVLGPETGHIGYHPVDLRAHGILDHDTSATFCRELEETSRQRQYLPRLKAPAGALVCPLYSFDTTDKIQHGLVRWYGSPDSKASDKLSLADVLSYGKDIKELAVYPHRSTVNDQCSDSFRIPHDTKPASLYTIYWMWNTTQIVGDGLGFQLYTSCFDIEIAKPIQEQSPLHGAESQRSETGRQPPTSANSQPALGVPSSSEHLLSSQSAESPRHRIQFRNCIQY
ncbi:hypothetical protein BDV23DRAFT_183836 [Aspergillus alliaceus]|uniref:DUF7492 domain-containing protein n=1 Tax=Petromyces alliaceus TaxID=209559 RepID=A0A5N7C973_PETAA|nr:hypothetical protein BDV23DRAFT_183836 [Aspergillus alliaceus]